MLKFAIDNRTAAIILALMIPMLLPGIVSSDNKPDRHHAPFGVYINLTEDFYRELKQGKGDTKTYSNLKSDEYLRQIAVSSKYMVESNLRILKQQEEMIQLLIDIKTGNKPK